MSIEKHSQVVSTNCQHFLINHPHGKDVHQIQPDKFTFLKSNLLVSNIINKSSSISKKTIQITSQDTKDAYINCQVEMKKLQTQTNAKKDKLQRVKFLAKCKSQITFDQFARQQKNINDQIQNVYVLRKQMVDKAGQIMGRKQDNTYLGRNLNKSKQKVFKELKQTNPSEKTLKTETVRLLMKQSAKKCNRKQLKQLLGDSTLNFKEMTSNGSSLDASADVSFLEVSNLKQFQKKVQHDQVLKKLIKSKSSDNFMQEQKRRAVWNGFSQHWRKGGQKPQPTQKKLKKQTLKKQLKPKFQTFQHEILNYNDHYSRFMALKRYKNAFAETSQSFQLKILSQI